MKKKILISLSVIAVVAAIAIGGTMALFSDTETSNGNIFTAGAIDLKVDHTKQTYNGQNCVGNCTEFGSNLIVNGDFENPDVPTGGYQIFADGTQTGWDVLSGGGLEIQDHAAGTPHGGAQLAELDSNNSSAIAQTLSTVAGQKYRLTFYYSPRPTREAGDNGIRAQVQVVSDSTILVDDTIGEAAVGVDDTTWIKYQYSFIATGTSVKVIFSDAGISNSYGGYLDDVTVQGLNCNSMTFNNGGTCTLWGARDLSLGDTFWNFWDIKPGDYGTNVISLSVTSNDAFACLNLANKQDNENTLVDPEVTAGDVTAGPTGGGELSNYLNVIIWDDNNDGIHQSGEVIKYNGLLKNLVTLSLPLTTSTTDYFGLAWCAGTQTVDTGTGAISCDGSGNQNDAQTDSFVSDVVATAVQQRNNTGFVCPGSN